jgi:hypothetical protein
MKETLDKIYTILELMREQDRLDSRHLLEELGKLRAVNEDTLKYLEVFLRDYRIKNDIKK